MLEINYINNKDSFELKKKNLQSEYDNKMTKLGAVEPPEKWKKPLFMNQIIDAVQDCEETIKKALFKLLTDNNYTDRNIKVNENYEGDFLIFVDEEISYALKMVSPAIIRYNNM